MLTIYYGGNSLAKRTQLLKDVQAYEDAARIRFDEITITVEGLKDTLGVMSLFSSQAVVMLDSVLEREDCKEDILRLLPELHQSSNQYFLLAGDVSAAEQKVFEKSGARLAGDMAGKKSAAYGGGSFALADAVGRRDKKSAWVLFRRAVDAGAASQEVCGTLIWQMRLIVLTQRAKTFSEAGVSEFPFKRAQSFARNYTPQDAQALLTKLLGIYHFDPAYNRGNTESAIEKVLLGL